MKKLIVSILSLVSLNINAIEIQCMDGDTHITVITSEQSGDTYILFDDGENLLGYFPLEDELIEITESSFTYREPDVEINLSTETVGTIIASRPMFEDVATLFPNDCKFLDVN